jgi:dimethylsulfone monooxygenase
VLSRLLREETVTHEGPLYRLEGTVVEPKPARPPAVYMGGESPKAKDVIATQADAYVMHGDAPEVIAGKVRDMNARRTRAGRPPLVFGVSGYVICRDSEAQAQAELERILDVRSSPEAYASYQDFVEGSQLESRVSLEEYSVSNRGLRSGLIGTPDQIIARLRAYEQAGVDLMLLQFSPQREEMARFGRDVIQRYSAA